MAIIYRMEDYRKNKGTHPATANGNNSCSLRELIGPVQMWASDAEKARIMAQQAERGLKSWRRKQTFTKK